MKRREFVAALGAAAAWPLVGRAQQPAMPVIGYLNATSPELSPHLTEAFRQGLKEIGFIEGQNVSIEYRWADRHFDRLQAMAADLVRHQVSVIVATGGGGAVALAAIKVSTLALVGPHHTLNANRPPERRTR